MVSLMITFENIFRDLTMDVIINKLQFSVLWIKKHKFSKQQDAQFSSDNPTIIKSQKC